MLEGPNTPEARNMLIELILSIPARLSDLLVVLTSLMRPLVMALQEGQELVGLGLRTLEYWVDRYDCLQVWHQGAIWSYMSAYVATQVSDRCKESKCMRRRASLLCYCTLLLLEQQCCSLCLAPHPHTSCCTLNSSQFLGTVVLSLLQLEPRVSGASNARGDRGSDEHTLGTPQTPEQSFWSPGTEPSGQDGWPQQALSQVTC